MCFPLFINLGYTFFEDPIINFVANKMRNKVIKHLLVYILLLFFASLVIQQTVMLTHALLGGKKYTVVGAME